MDPEEATAALEQQRLDVRAVAKDLVEGSERALSGRMATSSGQYRGCDSAFLDEFRNFRYLAQARVDAGPGSTAPHLDALVGVLEAAGFSEPTLGERPGGSTLTADHDAIGVTISELPDQGDYVLLSVAGPCVDVPEDQRDEWLTKIDPEPAFD
ncbi:MAG: hypothetical protein WKF50_08195 [Nocardioides sp.]